MMYDVGIQAEDGVTIHCHKCVVVARLEYFHSMLSSGWIEVSNSTQCYSRFTTFLLIILKFNFNLLKVWHSLYCLWPCLQTCNSKALTLPIPGDILEVLLNFLYTDEAATVSACDDPEFLCNVLVVADQLLIGRLKDMCEVAITQLCKHSL